jgi:hypothetical protein
MVVLSLDFRKVRLDAATKFLHHNTIIAILSFSKSIEGIKANFLILSSC